MVQSFYDDSLGWSQFSLWERLLNLYFLFFLKKLIKEQEGKNQTYFQGFWVDQCEDLLN